MRFELDARAALGFLRHALPDELRGLKVGFATAPPASALPPSTLPQFGQSGSTPLDQTESSQPLFYSVDRRNRTIVLYRMPIQRAQVLHVDDAEHRRLFIGHCVYRAVCEYLGADPWDLLPGRFDHF